MSICKEKSKETYVGIDLFKLIAATLIVLLHAVETSNFYASGIKYVFTRFAVPFFFISSGYFFSKGLHKTLDKKKYFIKYEKNLLKIFVLWALLIYSPFVIHSYLSNNEGASILTIIFLLVRRIIIIGPGPYWYIIALMSSVAYIYICNKYNRERYIILAMIIGFILQIMYASFQEILSNILIFKYLFKLIYIVYSWEFNFIMYGTPFLGIGYYIYKKDIRVPIKFSIAIFVCTTILRSVEYNMTYILPNVTLFKHDTISIAFIPQAISYFFIARDLNLNISKKASLIMRQLSSFIYFVHAILLYNILNPLLSKYYPIIVYKPEFILPKVMIVLVVCLILFILIKKINNRYLNNLINA